AVLQGVNEQRFAVVSLGAGFLVKLFSNIALIHLFGAKGAIFGTISAVTVAVLLNLWRIKTSVRFSFKESFKRLLLVLILSGIMCIVIVLMKLLLGTFISYKETRVGAIIMLGS